MSIKFLRPPFAANIRNCFMVFFCLFNQSASSQIIQENHLNHTQFVIDYTSQPKSSITDSPGYSFSSQQFLMGAFVPLFKKKFEYSSRNIIGFFLTPSLKLNNVNIDYLYSSRVLVNAGSGVGGYYLFQQKHSFIASIHALINEDEFTYNNPELRYGGLFLYSYKSNSRFSYYLGLTYTYVYGDIGKNGFLFPVIGTRFGVGENQYVNMMLPYDISYSNSFHKKFRLTVSLYPNGGINRYTDRSVVTSSDQVIMFRRRSFVLASCLYYYLQNNFYVGSEFGLLFGRKIFFTNENNTVIFEQNDVARGLQLSLKLIWRPWQNRLRQKEKTEKENIPDSGEDDLGDLNILGF